MSDINLDQEIQRLVDETKQDIEEAKGFADPGADSMERAGELAAQALRESFAEAAARSLAVGKLAMDEATNIDQACKEEAERLIAHGEERAQEIIVHFQHNQAAARGLKKIKEAMYNSKDITL